MKVRLILRLLVGLSVISVLCSAAYSQTRVNSTGTGGLHTIQGQIYAPNGRTLDTPVTVRLQSFSYSELTLITDHNGSFAFKRLAPGNYTVVVTDAAGCENVSVAFNYTGNVVSELPFSLVSVFPNPFNNFLVLQNLDGENEVELLNVMGEIVFKKKFSGKVNSVNTVTLLAGFYLLRIKSASTFINTVVVKK